MREIIIAGVMVMVGVGQAFAQVNVESLDVFVRKQLMIGEQDNSYSVSVNKGMRMIGAINEETVPNSPTNGLNVPTGSYTPTSKQILWDGKNEATLVHEIAHHYGANEDVSEWVAWCYEDLNMHPIQRVLELPLYALMSPLMLLSKGVNKLPGGWSEDQWSRYNGSTKPWPQEQWRK